MRNVWMILGLLSTSGCSAPAAVYLAFEGRVQSFATQEPIAGADVAILTEDGVEIGTGVSDATGSFIISAVSPYDEAGTAFVGTVEAAGFTSAEFHESLLLSQTRRAAIGIDPGDQINSQRIGLQPFSLAPESTLPGGIGGRVYNALVADQSEGVPGLVVSFVPGINAAYESENVLAELATNATGDFEVPSLPAGNYTAHIDGGTAWFDATFDVVSVGGAFTGAQNGATSPMLDRGQFRAVLSWGATPADLDSHLTGPLTDDVPDATGGSRFHVAYYNPQYPTGSGSIANLDVDDVTSFGPETVTVAQLVNGTYRYSVHDFSNKSSTTSTEMSFSRAVVQLFIGGGDYRTFTIPSGRAGTLWTVFEVSGDDGEVYDVGTFDFESNEQNIDSF